MKKVILGLSVALLFVGCGVSRDELLSELRSSRTDILSHVADNDVGTLDCAMTVNAAQTAASFCGGRGAYCNVLATWQDHCMRTDDEGNRLPPVRGVIEAMNIAVHDYDMAAAAASSAEEAGE